MFMNKENKPHVPQRTCVVCRTRKPKADLFRLVLDARSMVCFDRSRRLQGRGAYVCFKPECLIRLELKQLQKAFRRSLPEKAWNPAAAMLEALHS